MLAALPALACGEGSGDAGAGGGQDAAAGAADDIGGAGGNCAAYPTCEKGDLESRDLDACPPGEHCYAREMCGTRILCIYVPPNCPEKMCAAAGGRLVQSCPAADETRAPGPPWFCFPLEDCGQAIQCVDSLPYVQVPTPAGAACDPATQSWKRYVGDPAWCEGQSYECGWKTERFEDECGCGCAQNPECPPVIRCPPGVPDPGPWCDLDAFGCPFSTVTQ